ncbi:MAG: hypothetical protein AB7N71_01045 [Phycisphaerae bacterium]
MRTWLTGVSAIILAIGASSTSQAEHAYFVALDTDNEYPEGTTAISVSADGTTIIGSANSTKSGILHVPFRWQADSGVISLGAMADEKQGPYAETIPLALSADGAIIVGYARTDGSTAPARAFRWRAETGYSLLPSCTAGEIRAAAISATGEQIAGYRALGSQPFFWNSPEHTCALLNFPSVPNTSAVLVTDMDASGDIAIGYVIQSSPARNFGVRWFAQGGFEMIGEDRTPVGISADGTTIVSRFARWTEATGWLGIPPAIPGSLFGRNMRAASGNGAIIVGSDAEFLNGPPSAAIWDSTNGSRLLQSVLENEFGLDLSGWHLQIAMDISADGRVVVGNGIDPEGVQRGWRALLGTPLFALGDLNCDGSISVADIGPFVLVLTSPDMYSVQFPDCDPDRADLNNDGTVSVGDIGAFVALLTGA